MSPEMRSESCDSASVTFDNDMWEGRIAVTLGYPRYGCVLMAILAEAFNQSIVLHCSNAFPPFADMLQWLRDIQEDRLPARWEVDEEGYGRIFIVEKWQGSPDLAVLSVHEDVHESGSDPLAKKPQLKMRIDRRQLVNEFASRYCRWLHEAYDQNGFELPDDDDGKIDLRSADFSGLDTAVHPVCESREER